MTSFEFWQQKAAEAERFLCMICFEGFPLSEAYEDEYGDKWDVCRPCEEIEQDALRPCWTVSGLGGTTPEESLIALDETVCGCGHPRYQHLNGAEWCKAPFDSLGPRCTCAQFTECGDPPRAVSGIMNYFLTGSSD